jgi:hypothetical protein
MIAAGFFPVVRYPPAPSVDHLDSPIVTFQTVVDQSQVDSLVLGDLSRLPVFPDGDLAIEFLLELGVEVGNAFERRPRCRPSPFLYR